MSLLVEIPVGELIDKITILELKSKYITDSAKLTNVQRELSTLEQTRDRHLESSDELLQLTDSLRSINDELWQIEDDIRDCERDGDFGERFVALARAVYRTNDRRADVKRRINVHFGSRLVEEKSYSAY